MFIEVDNSTVFFITGVYLIVVVGVKIVLLLLLLSANIILSLIDTFLARRFETDYYTVFNILFIWDLLLSSLSFVIAFAFTYCYFLFMLFLITVVY